MSRKTSSKAATAAGSVLNDPDASKDAKTAAGSALAQVEREEPEADQRDRFEAMEWTGLGVYLTLTRTDGERQLQVGRRVDGDPVTPDRLADAKARMREIMDEAWGRAEPTPGQKQPQSPASRRAR